MISNGFMCFQFDFIFTAFKSPKCPPLKNDINTAPKLVKWETFDSAPTRKISKMENSFNAFNRKFT